MGSIIQLNPDRLKPKQIRALRTRLKKNGKILSDDHHELLRIHQYMDDPQASEVYRFIAAWQKWPYFSMPISLDEIETLLDNLPDGKRIQTKRKNPLR